MLLAADADACDGGGVDGVVGDQLMDHLDDGVPPVVRVLFGGAGGEPRQQFEGLAPPGDDAGTGFGVDDHPLDPLGAYIESQVQRSGHRSSSHHFDGTP